VAQHSDAGELWKMIEMLIAGAEDQVVLNRLLFLHAGNVNKGSTREKLSADESLRLLN
jgi:hypothetical protein